jgi:phage shock protein PspC (stress-responsive transcriptional regulator)
MPSLLRLLTVIAVLAAAVYGSLYALAHFVQPKPREISVTIPPDKFFKER